MSLNLVTVTWTEIDIGLAGLNGSVRWVPNTAWTDNAGSQIIEPYPRSFPVTNSAGQTVPLVATDNAGLTPAQPLKYYNVTVVVPGIPVRNFSTFLNFASGATQTLSSLNQIFPVPPPSGPFMPVGGGPFLGGVAPAVVQLSYAATVAVPALLANDFRLTLTGNATLANPTNLADGQMIKFRVTQDGIGSRLLSYGTAYDFGTAGAPTLSMTPNKMDIIGFEYDAILSKMCYLGLGQGF